MILSALEDFASRLNDYDVIVLPDLPRAPGPKLRQALLATTASVIGTGHTLHEDPQLLEQLFGVRIREKLNLWRQVTCSPNRKRCSVLFLHAIGCSCIWTAIVLS